MEPNNKHIHKVSEITKKYLSNLASPNQGNKSKFNIEKTNFLPLDSIQSEINQTVSCMEIERSKLSEQIYQMRNEIHGILPNKTGNLSQRNNNFQSLNNFDKSTAEITDKKLSPKINKENVILRGNTTKDKETEKMRTELNTKIGLRKLIDLSEKCQTIMGTYENKKADISDFNKVINFVCETFEKFIDDYKTLRFKYQKSLSEKNGNGNKIIEDLVKLEAENKKLQETLNSKILFESYENINKNNISTDLQKSKELSENQSSKTDILHKKLIELEQKFAKFEKKGTKKKKTAIKNTKKITAKPMKSNSIGRNNIKKTSKTYIKIKK